MNAKAYIEQLYASIPGLELYDFSENSNITELVINPLKQIFEDALGTTEINTIEEMYTWGGLSNINLDSLKALAQKRGIMLSSKQESSTLLTLHFSSPVDWEIKDGTSFVSGSSAFMVRDATNITKRLMAGQIGDKGLYLYRNLYVYNAEGDNALENTIGFADGA
ncbi:MAG: hypothetical protein Q8M92_05355, partial [Candidatus Subteraquimicrobiales bacterium]|nr:hypothetical protein [Candidatus Subteraquimicrobiales bacterium]